MLAVGGLLIFAAYTFGGYGYVLIRGWDITLKSWVDPLNPYQWPSGAVPLIPDYQIFPGQGSTATAGPSNAPTASQSAAAQRAASAAAAAGRTNPGSVAGRL